MANGDWRAAAKALEMIFPEYRTGGESRVSAISISTAPLVVLTPERRRELQDALATNVGKNVTFLGELNLTTPNGHENFGY